LRWLRPRFALIETRTVDARLPLNTPPLVAKRYQFDNHLGSACLELDDAGGVITYEEYYPHGGTAYQAGRSAAEVSLKRYRHTGKERDEESGLYYHGARYRAPWLCRWTSCDPAGLGDDVNLYTFVRNNPVFFTDPTGRWSWGKTLGIAAAVVVGVSVTALTGGALAPVVAGVIAGMAAGAAGEMVEACVDHRPVTLKNVLVSAAIGGLAGGLFAGAGSFLANTQIGQRIAAGMASSAVGQAVSRAMYRLATSPSRAAGATRAVAGAVRQGTEALEKLGEAGARRLGGSFAANAEAQAERRAMLEAARADAASRAGGSGVQATLQGEVNGQPYSPTTRSGVDRSGTGVRAIETPQGRVRAPNPSEVSPTLTPIVVPGPNGQAFSRGADAEFKLFGHTLLSTGQNATGKVYLGVTAPICPSCTAALWNTRAAIPGLQIITDMPSNATGAAGAVQTFVPYQREQLPPPVPILQLETHF
jgi:RHS repeat-associated protein